MWPVRTEMLFFWGGAYSEGGAYMPVYTVSDERSYDVHWQEDGKAPLHLSKFL